MLEKASQSEDLELGREGTRGNCQEAGDTEEGPGGKLSACPEVSSHLERRA